MLDKVKNALRVKTAAFDDEIQDLIDACKADLRLVGVNVPEDTPAEGKEAAAGDPLITRAIVLYRKGKTSDIPKTARNTARPMIT